MHNSKWRRVVGTAKFRLIDIIPIHFSELSADSPRVCVGIENVYRFPVQSQLEIIFPVRISLRPSSPLSVSGKLASYAFVYAAVAYTS